MKKLLVPTGLLLTPLAVFAQSDITGFVDIVINIINNAIVPLVVAVAFLAFIWGVFRYFIASNEETKEKGRDLMVYGLVGFFVIVSVWGLVNLLVGSFTFQDNPPTLPDAPNAGRN